MKTPTVYCYQACTSILRYRLSKESCGLMNNAGAQIYYHTADGGQEAFAAGILALKEVGCDIIVDDIFYFAEVR